MKFGYNTGAIELIVRLTQQAVNGDSYKSV